MFCISPWTYSETDGATRVDSRVSGIDEHAVQPNLDRSVAVHFQFPPLLAGPSHYVDEVVAAVFHFSNVTVDEIVQDVKPSAIIVGVQVCELSNCWWDSLPLSKRAGFHVPTCKRAIADVFGSRVDHFDCPANSICVVYVCACSK